MRRGCDAQIMKPPRRTIFKVLILLAAGATLNVAVAWGLAYWPTPYDLFGDGEFVRRKSVGPGVLDTYVSISRGKYSLSQSWHWPGISLIRWASEEEYQSVLPTWSRAKIGEPILSFQTRLQDPIVYAEFASGWPMLALRSMQVTRMGEVIPIVRTGYWELPSWIPWGDPNNPRGDHMPFVPIVHGFAINTLFYAGVLWVLFAGPFALRRMIRRRRGQCPACAYPLGQSPVCTECGAAVTATVVQE
jgi:hypothetical protein